MTTQNETGKEKRFEVQTYTLCDGWINTWSVVEEAGENVVSDLPETFATREEAQQALEEFFSDIQDEIDAGLRGAEEGYDPSDYRIVETQMR